MQKRLALSAALVLSFIATSCSTGTKNPEAPESIPMERQPNLETIAILGTNDIHGALAPVDLKTRENNGSPSVDYQAGGVAYLDSYIQTLKSEFGRKLIWLDAGDEFQGTIESNSNKGAAMVQFLNAAGVDAAAVGNHEFDFGADPQDSPDLTSSLKKRMAEAHYPYLAANIFDRATGKLADFPNTRPSMLIDTGKVKVGIIGLSTEDTPKTTRAEYVTKLEFGDLRKAALDQATALRKEGADLVVVVAHAGLFCETGKTYPGHTLRKPADPQGSCADNEIPELLKGLPAGTVDAVVSGHTHSIVHHWVNGVPVIQGGSSGRYFNVIYLTYDTAKHQLMTDRTRIEGPVPVCPKVFQNQGDCNGDRPAPKNGRGALVTPKFRREKIEANSEINSLLKPTFDAAATIKNEVYGKADRAIEHTRFEESPLGNLIADALRTAAKADAAVINSGGIRAPIEQGPITYGEIFRTLPFDNSVVRLKMTGKDLKLLIQIAESGSRGFPPVSGLQLRLIHPDIDAPSKDLLGNHKIEPWETDRVLSAKLADGSPIQDRKEYTVATIDFLVSGGDDLGWFMKRIPASHRTTTGILMRDAAGQYIKTLTAQQGAINSPSHPLVDPAHPRIEFVKIQPKKTKKHRRRRRRA